MNKPVLTDEHFRALRFLIKAYDRQTPYAAYTRLNYCLSSGHMLRHYNALCKMNPPLVERDPLDAGFIRPTVLGLRIYQEELKRRESR